MAPEDVDRVMRQAAARPRALLALYPAPDEVGARQLHSPEISAQPTDVCPYV